MVTMTRLIFSISASALGRTAADNIANEMSELGRRFHISIDEDDQSTTSSQNQVNTTTPVLKSFVWISFV